MSQYSTCQRPVNRLSTGVGAKLKCPVRRAARGAAHSTAPAAFSASLPIMACSGSFLAYGSVSQAGVSQRQRRIGDHNTGVGRTTFACLGPSQPRDPHCGARNFVVLGSACCLAPSKSGHFSLALTGSRPLSRETCGTSDDGGAASAAPVLYPGRCQWNAGAGGSFRGRSAEGLASDSVVADAGDAADFGRGAGDRCAGLSQGGDHQATVTSMGNAKFSSGGAFPRDDPSREPRARPAPSGPDGSGSTARSRVPWSGCWSARGGPRHPPSVPRLAGVPRRRCRAGGGCGNSRRSPRPRECSCLLLYSTIFRSGCFTLGRRDATARTKRS